ncbi:MAG TPA: type II toxin-antitoxin system prevent-host-death family antitoxin [Coxiellaceae bacterium]|nr:type II toxin-antitoxin system prevent-host-death family antitoxin [Coxiellaceae bacterium]
MSAMTIADARGNFSEIINRVAYGNERVVLTRHNKNVVAIIPLVDLVLLEEIEDRLDLQDAREAFQEAKEKGAISLDELRKKMSRHAKLSVKTRPSRRTPAK